MAEEKAGGTTEVIVKDGENSADIKVPEKTPEQLEIERLEKLNKEKDQELLAWRPKIEAANRILEEAARGGHQPPTTAAPAAPTFTREQYDRLVAIRDNPDEDERARTLAAGQIAVLHASSLTFQQTQRVALEAQLAELPKEDRAKARELIESGKARDVEDAAGRLRLERLTPLEEQNRLLREENARLLKGGGGKDTPTTHGRGPGGGGGGGDAKEITDSRYAEIMESGTPREQWDAYNAVKAGKLKRVPD